MNHSKAFWAVRNQYADQMRTLWSRGYRGEGLWGRGAVLDTGEFDQNTVQSDKDLPEHLCGGTYRSGRRKRKAKKQLSYQERKERRILKKFGANGVALGEDNIVKAELEKGKKTQGKPRVASSKRGRELRAAAALARFDQKKKAEEEATKSEHIDGEETESGSEFETASDSEEDATDDINGHRLVDNKGHRLVKVCEDEDPTDKEAENELKELFQSTIKWKPLKRETTSTENKTLTTRPANHSDNKRESKTIIKKPPSGDTSKNPVPIEDGIAPKSTEGACPMCSFDSGRQATICEVCSHVLDPCKVSNTWKCKSSSCRDSLYLNAGDSGICGVCGQRKGS